MSVQGKNSLSYKKKNTDNQNQPHTGFKNLVFGHQFASAGETIIPFDGLVQPSDWAQAGLINPIAPTLLAAQLQVFKKNITVTSSARGIIQKSEYTVHSNRIEFLNIESLVNEVFEVEVADLMITGNLIVDQQTIRVPGEMNNGETDFNMGYEFDIFNEEIIVFRDGIQMFRADNNDSSGATGNYYYLDNGNGRGSVLRFFEAAVGVEPILVVTTGGVIDPANVSTFQQIEHLAGQIDAMVPTLAALAGVPETDFQAAPNQVDLKAFGDLLINTDKVVNSILNIEIPIKTPWTSFTPVVIGDGGASWSQLVGEWRRDGENLEMRVTATSNGAGSGGAVLKFLYPNSLQASSGSGSVGFGREYNLGSVSNTWAVFDVTRNTDGVIFQENGTPGAYVGSDITASSQIYFHASVKIDGWAASQPISDLI